MATAIHCREPMETSPLITAVTEHDLKRVQSVIAKGADVNEQNADGYTALHLAISENAEFEILKLLLMNGSSVTIKDNIGYNPLQLINPDSFKMFLNLFRLEHLIDYSGGVRNTIMHLTMMTTIDNRHMWDIILSEFPRLNINFNAQNKIGHTPLHIAASRVSGAVDLKFILSHFSDLNLLVADEKGDTFLHTFLANVLDDECHISFLTCLLDGKYQCCPDAVLKQLLQSKNSTGHTPLHLCINQNDVMNIDMLHMFIKAGSEIDSENVFGENILHGLVRHFPEETDLIELAVSTAASVNAQNGFGESPIFFTDDIDSLQILIKSGADLKIKNKVGKTPLISYLQNPQVDVEMIEMFLANGADVDAKDVHGGNVLHYAAWNNVDADIVHLLKHAGAKIVSDKFGQLPCHVAQKRGYMPLVKELCICDDSVNMHSNGFTFQEGSINLQELCQQNFEQSRSSCIQERVEFFRRTSMSDVLKYPYLGSIMFQKEAGEVKSAVVRIIQNICTQLGKNDKMLLNSLIQSGSVGENTKVGLPDEFDFVCILDLFSSICEVDEAMSADDPGYAYVKLKPQFRGVDQYRHLFDQECYLDTEVLRRQFLTSLIDIIQNPDMCRHGNIIMEFGRFKESQLAPNCQLFLRWTSCEYEDILINVDLVPAIRIKGWWPQNANLDGLAFNTGKVRDDGSLLLIQTTFDEEYTQVTKIRISAQTAEKMHMASLPQIAREAYMMSKIISDERVCPRIKMSNASRVSYLRTNITSYMLKNCLFHVFEDENTKALRANDMNVSSKICSPESLHECVCKIFRKFLQCIKDEKLPAYVFPWQDVFTFQDMDCDLFPDQNHMKCTYRKINVKIILIILDEVEKFTDVDVNVLTSS